MLQLEKVRTGLSLSCTKLYFQTKPLPFQLRFLLRIRCKIVPLFRRKTVTFPLECQSSKAIAGYTKSALHYQMHFFLQLLPACKYLQLSSLSESAVDGMEQKELLQLVNTNSSNTCIALTLVPCRQIYFLYRDLSLRWRWKFCQLTHCCLIFPSSRYCRFEFPSLAPLIPLSNQLLELQNVLK